MDKTDEDLLIERILFHYDVEDIIFIQNISAAELVEKFRSEIIRDRWLWEDQL